MQIEKRRNPLPEPEILRSQPYDRSTVEAGTQKHYQGSLGKRGQRGKRKIRRKMCPGSQEKKTYQMGMHD